MLLEIVLGSTTSDMAHALAWIIGDILLIVVVCKASNVIIEMENSLCGQIINLNCLN